MSLYDTKPDGSLYGSKPERASEIFDRIKRNYPNASAQSRFADYMSMATRGLRVLRDWEILYLAAVIDDEFRRRICRARDQGLSDEHITSLVTTWPEPHFFRSGKPAELSPGFPVHEFHFCQPPDGDLPASGTKWNCICGMEWTVAGPTPRYPNTYGQWYKSEDLKGLEYEE